MTRRGRAHVRRDLAIVAATGLALALPFALVALRGVGHVGWLLVRRPLHIESGRVDPARRAPARRLRPDDLHQRRRLGDLAGPAARAVAVIGSLAEGRADRCVVLFARGPRGPRELLLAVAAAVVAFATFGKVLSPQYLAGRGGRAARARPSAVRPGRDGRRAAPDALHLRRRLPRPAGGRAGELGHARAEPRPGRPLLLAGHRTRGAKRRVRLSQHAPARWATPHRRDACLCGCRRAELLAARSPSSPTRPSPTTRNCSPESADARTVPPGAYLGARKGRLAGVFDPGHAQVSLRKRSHVPVFVRGRPDL